MSNSKTIKLSKPFEIHNKKVTEVVVKEPNGALYAKLGNPTIPCFNNSGSVYEVEQIDVIGRYIDALIDQQTVGGDILSFLCLEDSIAIKDAVLGFFGEARARLMRRNGPASSSASAS